MKKEIIIIITIIITIIIAHAISQNYVLKFFKSISDDLDIIQEKIMSEEYEQEGLKKDINSIQKKWNEKYDIFACFVEHDELEKVQTQLISIEANIKVEDYDKSVDEIERCKFILKHIEEKDSFKIVNIF